MMSDMQWQIIFDYFIIIYRQTLTIPTMDHYNRMSDDIPPVPQNNLLIIGYSCQLVLYALIITYCILLPSLFSTIALGFMLVSVFLTVATPYYLSSGDKSSRKIYAVAYPVERVIWASFILLNLGILGFKLSVLISDSYDNYSPSQQTFYELQSNLAMFLPLILLPFAGGSMIIRTKNRPIQYFKTKPNSAINIPIFMSLGILAILIEAFSISMAGFLFFICALAMFVQRKLVFENIWSEILVNILGFICFGFVIANFIATTDEISSQDVKQIYRFYGIDALNNFLYYSVARGYFICLILQFLLTALTQRIFIYFRIWKIANDIIEIGEIKQDEIFREQGIKIQEIDSDRSSKSLEQHVQDKKVRGYSLQQFEMQSVRSSSVVQARRPHQTEEVVAFRSLPQPGHFEIPDPIQPPQKEKKQSKATKVMNSMLWGMNAFVEFIYSTQFCLRATQLLSIIVISRYNNIFSFIAVLWLAGVASIERIKVVFYITGFVLLPVQLTNFIIMYWYNAPESPLAVYSNMEIYGFFSMQEFWLDIIIFNIYFFYMITYLLAASRDSRQTFHQDAKKPELSFWVFAVAFIFRYTYLLTILGLFFMGFSVVNVINLIYVIMFLVFFSSGENILVDKKTVAGKQLSKMTTFSRKYWFLIVYYTLLCVIAKYAYFLFFSGDLFEQLQPTGINYEYHWSFNLSLSSVCKSNTTPFFLLFILSQSQIIIFRSPIYLNYSFSLMSQMSENSPNQKGKLSFVNSFASTVLEFYYQSLYYISGFIFLLCSYRWDINGLITVGLTCWGLLQGFSKKILGLIVFIDLGFMLANYIALFIDYEIIVIAFGETAIGIIYKFSLLLGFKMSTSVGLTAVFALNIVIFYFSVECYRLCKLLQERRFDKDGRVNNEAQDSDNQMQDQFPDAISNFQPTIIQSEYEEDKQFARNYHKNVIIGTQMLYNVNLWRKYRVWNYICRFLSIFMVDIITLLVVILCLDFRISISMFYYLSLYMLFYYNLFNDIGILMKEDDFYEKIFNEINRFHAKQALITQRNNPRPIITGQQATQSVANFIETQRLKALKLKLTWKQIIWKYSSIFTAVCIILSYSSQFFISSFYNTYMNYSWTVTIQQILFVLGVSVNENSSYARQTYFYYIMLMMCVIEMLLFRYIKDISSEEEVSDNMHKSFDYKIYQEYSDPEQYVNLQCDFIESVELDEELVVEEEVKEDRHDRLQYDDCARQANLLIYFDYKKAIINVNLTYGFMMGLLRLYLLMMMINIYEESNIFSFAYLIAILYFWFQSITFQLVNDINKAAIVILLLQYFALLLDISPQTSPIPLPDQQNLSLLQKLISDPEWINFILFVSGSNSYNTFIEAFLISSIIIFLTEFYYTIFFWISKSIIGYIRSIYERYEYIQQKIQQMPENDTIYLNYSNYKNGTFRILNLSYQLLINNSYIFVSILILILLSGVHTYLAVGLVFFACVYIYLGIFTKFSEDSKLFVYTSIFFKIIRAILFLILIVSTIFTIPVFDQTSDYVINIQNLSNLTQIFLILFIQLWLDLSVTDQFKSATLGYNTKVHNRQNVLIKCLAYQQNEGFIRRLIQRYKEVMWFEVNLADSLDIIDEWHRNMYKEKIPEFQNIKDNLAPLPMEDLRREIKQDLARRPDEDASIIIGFTSYMQEHINVTLKYRYYEIMRFIVFSNHRLIRFQNQNIDIWDYVLENYEKLYEQIKQAERTLGTITKQIQAQYEGYRMLKVEEIKNNSYSSEDFNLDEEIMGRINTPQKIFLHIKPITDNFFKTFWDFFISNFSYFLSFFIWIYYLINPCLLSLPFIVYLFSYEIISTHKLTPLMLLYVFTIIIFALLVQLQFFSGAGWIQYFFLTSGTSSVFAIGYLYFIFVLIFINEEIKKYQGNKFKYVHEAENTRQGALRILMNSDKNSELDIWKLKTDIDYEEKECNPMNYFAQKIEKHPEDLTQMQVPGFFQSMEQGKTGKDFYPLIATVQIFLTIYMIFLYPFMVHSEAASLADSFKYFQFSSSMVLAVLANVVAIVIERWITLLRGDQTKKLKIKYWYTMILLGLFLIFIYYIAPVNHYVSNQYYPKGCLIAFSFFYFFYFFFSGLQIRFGYKKYKSLNSMMSRRRQFNNFFMICYVAIPFLYELKLSMDWAFCETSLKIFDWFRLFTIYYSAFKAKMQYYSSTGVTLGDPVSWIMKSLGWITFIGILLIIFLPMVLFSGLNPIAQNNLVIGGSLVVGIQVKNGNYFELYSTSHLAFPPQTYTYDLFQKFGFKNVPVLSTLTSSDVQNQFQFVSYQPFSDNNWGISNPNLETLLTKIRDSINNMNQGMQVYDSFQIIVQYELYRRIASTVPENNKFYYPYSENNDQYLNITQLEDLNHTISTCNSSIYFPNFYIDLIRLNTVGDTYKPRPINYTAPDGTQPYVKGVFMSLYCNSNNNPSSTNDVYWGLNTTNSSNPNDQTAAKSGLNLNVYCDKYQNLIGGLGFTALYTSVILVVANLIRGAFQSNLPNIPYYQNPKPDNIIQISEAIGTLRLRKQFREEYLMYYQLIDIIRSPDMMKFLSGSFPALIEQADQKRQRKQKEKFIASQKDKIE